MSPFGRRATELPAQGPGPGEALAGALRDQVALDLGEQREERGHDLRLDVALALDPDVLLERVVYGRGVESTTGAVAVGGDRLLAARAAGRGDLQAREGGGICRQQPRPREAAAAVPSDRVAAFDALRAAAGKRRAPGPAAFLTNLETEVLPSWPTSGTAIGSTASPRVGTWGKVLMGRGSSATARGSRAARAAR